VTTTLSVAETKMTTKLIKNNQSTRMVAINGAIPNMMVVQSCVVTTFAVYKE